MKFLYLFLCLFYFGPNSFALQETYTLAAVDEAPYIAECYDPNKDSKECFNQKLIDFLQSKLVTPKTVKGEGKAYTTFVITETGAIKDVQVRALEKDQEDEVIRVLSSLNIASPAKIKGQPVAITHALPVIFKQTIFNDYSVFFETRAKDLPHAMKTAFPPLFEECITENNKSSCFQKILEEKIKNSVQGAKRGTVLNYYLEINERTEIENVLVMSRNNNANKQAKAILETITVSAPARNKQKQAKKSYYYGNLVL